MKREVLEVNNLKVKFKSKKKSVTVVEDVSFSLKEGETLGIVGESGSGKSVTSLSIMGLLPNSNGSIDEGHINFNGVDLASLSKDEMRKMRGKSISMIFQEPMTSLNPAYKIGNQIMEPILVHEKVSKKVARERAIELLKRVEISRAEEIIDSYPHQLSGGMRQRVMIAIALACNPALLIADEPTTALDVTIQAQILELMKKLKSEFNTSIIIISHDLGVIAEMCDRVVVMYAGKVVEEGPVEEIFSKPQHPYTIGLLKSTPKLRQKVDKLYTIQGNVPTPHEMPIGCRFAPRCENAMEICFSQQPAKVSVSPNHDVNCWLKEGADLKDGQYIGS